ERVIKIEDAVLAEDDFIRLVSSRHELGSAYLESGQSTKGNQEFQYVVRSTERHLEETHPDLLISQHELSGTYRLQAQAGKAIANFEYVICISVTANQIPGDHPDLLVTKRQLAPIRMRICCQRP
ncbi:hypothetical protein T440DRAFT_541512, partial [Plenodomus tracheiphilus IPT5]